MSTPYHFTPRMPAAPHPTPSSITKVNVSGTQFSRAPIQNPYDKFTQPEFDAWIGGITSALKHALGQEEPEVQKLQKLAEKDDYNPYSRLFPQAVESEDEVADDSFAEIKARRAANNKGKGRDPREGPGLGKGDRNEPINIPSSDEEDAVEEEEVADLTIGGLEEEEESDILPPGNGSEWKEGVVGDEYYGGEDQEEVTIEEDCEEYVEDENKSEEDYMSNNHEEDTRKARVYPGKKQSMTPEDLIHRPRSEGSDDEDEQEEYDEEGEEYEEYEEEYDQREGSEEEEEEGQRPVMSNEVIEIDDDDEEIEEIQPPEDDTSFPPKSSRSLVDERHVEIRDPWVGPRSYAQDFYSGGDRIRTGKDADPHYLESGDEDEDINRDIKPFAAEDVEQLPDENTSFSLAEREDEHSLEIEDVWANPERYAEDLYSGGDFRTLPGGQPNPHYVSNQDAGHTGEVVGNDREELEFDEIQPKDQNTAFPSQTNKFEPPVDLPNQWEGPIVYAEDYYSGGDILSAPDMPIPIDPSLLSGTAGVDNLEDDIDSFLTPNDLSAARTPVLDEEDNEGVTLLLPTFDPAIGPSAGIPSGGRPVPVNATIINDIHSRGEQGVEGEMDDEIIVEEDSLGLEHSHFEELHHKDERIIEDGNYDGESHDDVEGNVIAPPNAVADEDNEDEVDQLASDVEESEVQLPEEHYVEDSCSPSASEIGLTARMNDSIETTTHIPQGLHARIKDDSSDVILPGEIIEPETTAEISKEGESNSESIVVEESTEKLQSVQGSSLVEGKVDDNHEEKQTGKIPFQEKNSDKSESAQVPDEVDTGLVEESLPEESSEAHGAAALVETSEADDYDIRSTPGLDEGIAPSVSARNNAPLPPEHTEIAKEHSVVHDISDDADLLWESDAIAATLSIEMEIKSPKLGGYTVSEVVDDDAFADENAIESVENEAGSEDLVIFSVSPSIADDSRDRGDFIVEETEFQMEGRLTEEPVEREMSLRVESVSPEEPFGLEESKEIVAETSPDAQNTFEPKARERKVKKTDSLPQTMQEEQISDIVVTEHVRSNPADLVNALVTGDPTDLQMLVVSNVDISQLDDRPPTPSTEGYRLHVDASKGLSQTAEPNNREVPQNDGEKTENPRKLDNTTIIGAPDITDTSSAPEFTSYPSIGSHDGTALSRKASIPILMAEPYPYSLSTPGIALEIGHDEASEDDAALNNSMSSHSTIEKEEQPSVNLDDLNSYELQYPSSPDDNSQPKAVPSPNESVDLTPSAMTKSVTMKSPLSPPNQNIMEDLRTIEELAPPPQQIRDVFTTDPENPKVDPSIKDQTEKARSSQSKRKRDATEGSGKKAGSAKGRKGRKSIKSDGKWKISEIDIPAGNSNETILVKPKRKALKYLEREESVVSQGSHSSATDATRKILQPGSRASSVTSTGTTPSEKSLATEPSPTLIKPTTPLIQPFIAPLPLPAQPATPPVSLLHAHGAKRKAQALTHKPLPNRSPSQPTLHSVPESAIPAETMPVKTVVSANEPFEKELKIQDVHIGPSVNVVPSSLDTSASSAPPPGTPTLSTRRIAPAASPPATLVKPASTTSKATSSPSHPPSSTSSPVTRSHCRYHKISLPKEEGGPRICFLVPGCSLTNRQLMQDEEVVDHGDATLEDSLNMAKDIESLGFSLDVIGVLRQLVGLDILREQEVFYLPQPGEGITRKHAIRKSMSEKSAIIRASTVETSNHGSPPTCNTPGHNKPPSVADSTSTTLSGLRNVIDHESVSIRGETEEESSDNGEPEHKRLRPSLENTGVMKPPTNQGKGKQRSRFKQVDEAYNPEEEPEEKSDEELTTKKKRKSTATRGTKRSRTAESAVLGGEGSSRKSKKLKSHATAPQLSPSLPAPQPSHGVPMVPVHQAMPGQDTPSQPSILDQPDHAP